MFKDIVNVVKKLRRYFDDNVVKEIYELFKENITLDDQYMAIFHLHLFLKVTRKTPISLY